MKYTVRRVAVYIAGIFIMAVGVVFSMNSGLGVSPVSSLFYVAHSVTGASIFICATLIYLFYVVLQIIILRRDFKWKNLAQVIFSTIFSFFANYLAEVMKPLIIPTYPGKLVMIAISIVLVAFGILLYMVVDLVPMPLEGLALAISTKSSKPFHLIKNLADIVIVALSIIIGLLAAGRLIGVREGTILSAILIGRVLGWLTKPLAPRLRRFCFGPDGAKHDILHEPE